MRVESQRALLMYWSAYGPVATKPGALRPFIDELFWTECTWQQWCPVGQAGLMQGEHFQ